MLFSFGNLVIYCVIILHGDGRWQLRKKLNMSDRWNVLHYLRQNYEITQYYTERKICLNLFETRKIVLVLEHKIIFLCNKEKYIWFKCLFFILKTHFLNVETFFDLNTIFLILNTFSLRKTIANFLSV